MLSIFVDCFCTWECKSASVVLQKQEPWELDGAVLPANTICNVASCRILSRHKERAWSSGASPSCSLVFLLPFRHARLQILVFCQLQWGEAYYSPQRTHKPSNPERVGFSHYFTENSPSASSEWVPGFQTNQGWKGRRRKSYKSTTLLMISVLNIFPVLEKHSVPHFSRVGFKLRNFASLTLPVTCSLKGNPNQ